MKRNIKKILDKSSGQKINSIRVITRSPYDATRYVLTFKIEIEEAKLLTFSDEGELIELYLNVSNRKVNDEIDNEEFGFRFQNAVVQELLKEEIYQRYKIELFGVSEEDLEIEYRYL